MAKGAKTIWLAQLDRFEYTLTAVGKTKEEAISTIMKSYSKAYKDANGVSPGKEYPDYGDGKSYYYCAKGDINFTELEFGKCEWL